tara:strand:- start:348 stop:479 length:132 start_codon:yes stop_codon:yes gene_type:complete
MAEGGGFGPGEDANFFPERSDVIIAKNEARAGHGRAKLSSKLF